MTRTRRIAATLGGAAAVLAAMTAPTYASEAPDTAVTAQSCSATRYFGEGGTGPGHDAHWPDTGRWATVSGRCGDIKLSLDSGPRTVRVCTRSACNSWKRLGTGEWTVIAHHVIRGKEFYVQFKGVDASNGWIQY
ncbi:hypothetical protein ACQB60_15795 [Actinomycetota bacterium Odt1-20B]